MLARGAAGRHPIDAFVACLRAELHEDMLRAPRAFRGTDDANAVGWTARGRAVPSKAIASGDEVQT